MEKVIKICLIGTSGSGKTSLINFLTGWKQSEEYQETWGVEVRNLNWMEAGESIRMEFWDTSPLFLKKSVFMYNSFLEDCHYLIYVFPCITLISLDTIETVIHKTRKDRMNNTSKISNFVEMVVITKSDCELMSPIPLSDIRNNLNELNISLLFSVNSNSPHKSYESFGQASIQNFHPEAFEIIKTMMEELNSNWWN